MDAFRWMAYGFSLFGAAPLGWAAMALVGTVVYALPFAVPGVGFFVGSVAVLGFDVALVVAAEAVDHGEPVRVRVLVEAWDARRARAILRIGWMRLLTAVMLGGLLHLSTTVEDQVLVVCAEAGLGMFFLFAVSVATLTDCKAGEAMQSAAGVILQRPLQVGLFAVLTGAVVLLGALSVVGLLIALPVVGASVYAASRALFGQEAAG